MHLGKAFTIAGGAEWLNAPKDASIHRPSWAGSYDSSSPRLHGRRAGIARRPSAMHTLTAIHRKTGGQCPPYN